MKKKTATFVFESTYNGTSVLDKKTASVLLTVNYGLGTFSVSPTGEEDVFVFMGDSDIESDKWLATINCIQKAVTFGRMETGQEPEIEQAPICRECQKSF